MSADAYRGAPARRPYAAPAVQRRWTWWLRDRLPGAEAYKTWRSARVPGSASSKAVEVAAVSLMLCKQNRAPGSVVQMIETFTRIDAGLVNTIEWYATAERLTALRVALLHGGEP